MQLWAIAALNPKPDNFRPPYELPDSWDFGHHNYLQVDPPPSPFIAGPTDIPAQGSRPACEWSSRLAGGMVGCILLYTLSVRGVGPQVSSPAEIEMQRLRDIGQRSVSSLTVRKSAC